MASKTQTNKNPNNKKRKISSKGWNIIRKSVAGVMIASGLIVAAIPEDKSGIAAADEGDPVVILENEYKTDSADPRNGEFPFVYNVGESINNLAGKEIYISFEVMGDTMNPQFDYFITKDKYGLDLGVVTHYYNVNNSTSLDFDGVVVAAYETATQAEYKAWYNAHQGDTATEDGYYTDIDGTQRLYLIKDLDENRRFKYFCAFKGWPGFTLKLVKNNCIGKKYKSNGTVNTVEDADNDGFIYVYQLIERKPENSEIQKKCDANGFLAKEKKDIQAIGRGAFAKNPDNLSGSTSANAGAGQNYSALKSIKLSNKVIYLCDNAFEGALINNIEIPSVQYIGNYVFKDCYDISSIELNKDMQYIGKEAFYSCSKLQKIVMPSLNVQIGFGAFAKCSKLSEVDFAKNQNQGAVIGEYAFFDCINLSSVKFYEDGFYGLGKACFALANSENNTTSSMTDFNFPTRINVYESYTDGSKYNYPHKYEDVNGAEKSIDFDSPIGDYLFANRTKLEHVKMSHTYSDNVVQWIPKNIFDNCTNLAEFEFDPNNSLVYYDRDLFEDVKNEKFLVTGPAGKVSDKNSDSNPGSYANPRFSTWNAHTNVLDYVTYRYYDEGGSAHYEVGQKDYRYELKINDDNATASIISCELIRNSVSKNFIIPGQVADYNIVDLAEGCLDKVKNDIETLTIEDDSILTIGDNVFAESANLREVSMGNSVRELGASCFKNCPKLEKITIGKNIESVGEEAFKDCAKLKDVYWDKPESYNLVESIGNDAFKTESEMLYFHCDAASPYLPFEYAMGDNTINKDSIRICCKTLEPEEYAIIKDEETGLNTLIDYPVYADLDPDIRALYESGSPMNEEQQAKLNATVYLHIPEMVESIDVRKFLDPSSDNPNKRNWIYIEDSCPANFISVNGNDKKNIYGNDKINISEYYADGYTAGLFSGFQKDTVPLGAAGEAGTEKYTKGNDWIKAVEMQGVKSIPAYAFDSCERLESVIIGDDCEEIGEAAFQGCDRLLSIGTSDNQKYIFENKILYESLDDGTLEINTCLPSRGINGESGEIWVETANDPLLRDVASIKEGAFTGCDSIKKVDLTDTRIDYVPRKTFYGCTTLSDVTLPDTVKNIASEAFDEGAPNLNLTIPCDSLISDTAFDRDANVTIWTYPNCPITAAYRAANNKNVYIKFLDSRFTITYLNDDMSIYEKIYVAAGANGFYPEEDPAPKLPSNQGFIFLKWNFDHPDGIRNVNENRTAQAIFTVSGANVPSADPGSSASPAPSKRPGSNNGGTNNNNPAANSSASPGPSASAAPSALPQGSASPDNKVTYLVTVENGAGSGSYQPGQVVTITAYAPPSGKEFDIWTTSNADIGFSDNKAVSTTFIMPTHDVKVTATYKTPGAEDKNASASSRPNVSGNAAGATTGSTGNNRGSGNGGGTDVTVTTSTIDNNNKNLVSATVAGSTDNFIVKITDSAASYAEVERALKNAYGNDISNIKFVAFDISLYDETGQNRIPNHDNLAVTITIPIPDDLVSYAGNNQVCAVVNGVLDDKTTKFTTIDGVPCMTFTATHFSPYGVYVNTAALTAGVTDQTPKTGDGIAPKWFLAIGLGCMGGVLFLWKDKKKVVPSH